MRFIRRTYFQPTWYDDNTRSGNERRAACSLSVSFLLPQLFLPLLRLVRLRLKFCFRVKTWLQFRFWLSAHISQLPLGCSHSVEMLSWGQDSRRGFRVNDDTAADGVPVFFQPGYSVRELAASRGARAFVCGDGDAFMIRGDESDAGRTGTVKHSEFSFSSMWRMTD